MSTAALLIRIVTIAYEVYFVILLIRIIMSWIRFNPYSKFFRIIFDLTEPLLGPIRKLIFKLFRSAGNIGLDFSPIILLLLLSLVRQILVYLIYLIF